MKRSPIHRHLRPASPLALALMLILPLIGERADVKADAGCTTIMIGRKATADGSVMIAHNEDYGDNDCMHLIHHPRETHAPGEVIRFAFETVPQVTATYAYTAIEMYSEKRLGMPPAKFLDGMNEYGLSLSSNCIDCREAVEPFNKGLGWPEIGQIVLQRCKTAREAVELSAKLVDQYTFNGFEATSCKNLAFLIADSSEAWLMEVTKRHWIAKRCPDEGAIFYANQALIETDWDMASADLIPYAVAQRWYDPGSGKKFNFREVYGTGLGDPRNVMREERARELLAPKLGSMTVQDLVGVMRDHYEGKSYSEAPHRTKTRPICSGHTNSTQIYHLRGTLPAEIGCIMWSLVGSPCLGVFTPIWAGYKGGTPMEWRQGLDSFSSDSAWWTFENIQRIAAPTDNPNPEFWKSVWPALRARFDNIEKAGADRISALEKDAMKLWERGEKGQTGKLLTDYTNARLHSDFQEARSILAWLKAKGGETAKK